VIFLVYENISFQKQYEKAILIYKKSVLNNPELYYVYNDWGSSLSNLGRFDEAIEKFNQALEMYPGYTISLLNLILALFLKKSDEEALKYFDKIKTDNYFRYSKGNMRFRYQKEMQMLDVRISEIQHQDQIKLIQERKKGFEKLLDLLSDKEETSE